jgi:predicted AlkP superfamily pyrophosphatase or phosphodiesterase
MRLFVKFNFLKPISFNFEKMFSMKRRLLFTLFFLSATGSVVFAQKKTDLNNGIDRPKLVVGIVIDQMRWDYLYRYYNKYSEDGFKRLINKGFSYENTMIPYTPTVTAAGHTCIYTGSVPAVHGIVGNDWIERSTGNYMYCAQDKTVQTVGSPSSAGQMSPRNMMATTIGDELRLATNFKSRVYGIAIKDRGGILPAGHSANAAYWFDDSTGNWISSTYYMNALPQWVQGFNAEKQPDAMAAKNWNLLYDPTQYDQSTADSTLFEKKIPGEATSTFPHMLTTKGGKNYFALRYSPYGNTLTMNFAKRLIEKEQLGMSGQTDMLCVSFSSTDYVGHTFGPQSLEIEDTYLRLDKDLENFFEYLDEKEGKGNYVVFLSADHGAPQSPEFLKSVKVSAGTLQGSILLKDLNTELLAKFKVSGLIQSYIEYQFYFNQEKLQSGGLNANEVYDYTVDLLLKRPEVMNAFSYTNFQKTILPEPLKQRLTNGYYSKRSGDVQMILRPQYTDYLSTGTDHGVWLNYDAHIPLLFYGWGIKPGKTNRETYMTDIAPTITALLHIQMPNGTVGKVLPEVVK